MKNSQRHFELRTGRTYVMVLHGRQHLLCKRGPRTELIITPLPGCVTCPFDVIGMSFPLDADITAKLISQTTGKTYYGEPHPQSGYWDFQFNNVPVDDYTLLITGGVIPDEETLLVRTSCTHPLLSSLNLRLTGHGEEGDAAEQSAEELGLAAPHLGKIPSTESAGSQRKKK